MQAVVESFYFGIESLLKLHEKGLVDPENWEKVFEDNFENWFGTRKSSSTSALAPAR